MSPNDIQQIIDKYGRPVYEAAVRQVYVNSVLQVVWAIVAVICSIVLWRSARRAWKKSSSDNEEWIIVAGLAYAASVILALVSLGLLTDASGALLNPTWKAVEIILGAVGK